MDGVQGDAVSATAAPGADGAVTVRIPLTFRKRGGRKVFISPDGALAVALLSTRIDNALIKALARAFRWRKLLEAGTFSTVEELAAAEKINASYVSRILRLTLLAPEIVEAILDGRQPAGMTLAALMKGMPAIWRDQTWPSERCKAKQARAS